MNRVFDWLTAAAECLASIYWIIRVDVGIQRGRVYPFRDAPDWFVVEAARLEHLDDSDSFPALAQQELTLREHQAFARQAAAARRGEVAL
jgi:hypothetical protein